MSIKGFGGRLGSMVAMMGAGFALLCLLPALLIGSVGAAWLGAATGWGCDLTEQYVVINSEYTT